MEIKLNEMCKWERQKACFLMQIADSLGMDWSDSYGGIAVNQTSGKTYLWSEDYPFTLYMPINCELKKSDVVALWTNPENGEEHEYNIGNATTLEDLYEWVKEKEKEVEEANNDEG